MRNLLHKLARLSKLKSFEGGPRPKALRRAEKELAESVKRFMVKVERYAE